MNLQIKKATRKAVKLKMNLSAPSGAGKTMSALRLGRGLVGNWNEIVVIDTENGSSQLYSHLGDFNTIELTPPFTPEKYNEAIKLAVDSGMKLCIIDSTSHEWACLLEENQKLADAKFRGNSWSAWSQSTPRHDLFINTILHSNIHIITCTRSKTETVMGEDKKVKKIGMKDNQREGFEYELSLSLEIDRDTHLAYPSKDRTNLFEGKNPFLITEATGELIKKWCESGVSEKQIAINEMEVVQSIDELKTVWSKYKSLQKDEDFVTAKDNRKDELTTTTK